MVGCESNYNPGNPAQRYYGYGFLACDTGEDFSAAGCVFHKEKPTSCSTRAGDPVDVKVGVLVEGATDYTSSGDHPLQLRRYYWSDLYSQFILSGRLGGGWQTNYDAVAHYSGDPTNYPYGINIRTADGRDLVFNKARDTPTYTQAAYNAASKSWYNLLNAETISYAGSGNWALTALDDTVYTFNSSGQLTTIASRDGYTQTLTWVAGQNTAVTDSYGRTLGFAYDVNGLLTSVITSDGQTIKYGYVNVSPMASNPNLAGLVFGSIGTAPFALQKVTFPGPTNPTITYQYGNSAVPYALTGKTDERGVQISTWSWTTDGRVSQNSGAGGVETYGFSYDLANNKTTVTNPLNKQTVYQFANNRNGPNTLSQIQGVASAHCVADNTSFAYDGNFFVNQTTDGEGRVTTYVNNASGLPTSITRGAGTASATTTTYSWHPTWRVPTEMVELGRTTDYAWNTSGQLTSVTLTDTTTQTVPYSTNGQTRTWTFGYTGLQLTSVDGPLAGSGDTVSYAYDTNGFVHTVTNEVGLVTTITSVNGLGQPTLVTDPNGIQTALAYDAVGRLTGLTADSAGSAAATTIAYDAAGDITKVTRPDGSYQSFTWDDARRLTTITNNSGETINYTHDNMGGVTAISRKKGDGTVTFSRSQTFDELGRLLTAIGASSQTWTYGYDKTSNATSVTDPRSNLYAYGFDALNRLISETDQENSQVSVTRNGVDAVTAYQDPRSLTTSYVRNGFGEVIQEASPDRGTTVYQRDARGLVTQKTDARGVVTNFSYDNAGRLTAKSFPASTAENVTYGWDSTTGGNKGAGRLTGMSDATGTTAWAYDARGNVRSETRGIAGNSYVVSYSYDAADHVISITYPSGRIVTYVRDTLGRVSGVTTKQSATSAAATLASNIVYQPYGALQWLTYGNGLSLWKTFTGDDELNQLLLQNTTTNTNLIQRFHTRTDNGLNLTNIWDNLDATKNQSFWYTASRRLQNASGPWGSLTYSYDGVGNRTYETSTVGSTTSTKVTGYASSSNQMAQVTTDGTVTRSYGYDAAGNLTTDTHDGATWTYAYNNAGRLATATAGTSLKGSYSYDGLERLAIRVVSNTTPSGTTHLVYDTAGHVIAEANGLSGTTTREYVWLPNEEAVDPGPMSEPTSIGALSSGQGININAMSLAVVSGVDTGTPATYFVHSDHLDRPIKMTDGSASSVWDAIYLPFGAVYSITGTASLDARFPGQWFQLETGLAYNWHRHYDATTGRYTQSDPLGFINGPSTFAYATNSPLVYTDILGLADHHLIPQALWNKSPRDVPIEARQVFDDATIYAGETHNFSGGHPRYNRAVRDIFQQYCNSMNKLPSQLTAEDAMEIVSRVVNSQNPDIVSFNRMVRSQGVMSRFRSPYFRGLGDDH
ncbi:RHS repeat-associated core domain-containing protein [Rhizobiales bacterium GAS191]|nr:RHS repeat-associated core domain-containing protein [Rhizobiales bacterium GAS191]